MNHTAVNVAEICLILSIRLKFFNYGCIIPLCTGRIHYTGSGGRTDGWQHCQLTPSGWLGSRAKCREWNDRAHMWILQVAAELSKKFRSPIIHNAAGDQQFHFRVNLSHGQRFCPLKDCPYNSRVTSLGQAVTHMFSSDASYSLSSFVYKFAGLGRDALQWIWLNHCAVAVPHIQSLLSSSRKSPLRISDHLSLPNDKDDHSREG